MLFNIKNYEYDCTSKCRLRSHGNQITAALTKRSMDDEKLAAFIAKTCCNFYRIVDDLGRSALHLAASVDRYAILEWLLNQGASIGALDFESGSSALHRAIYYGCINSAVLLQRYGASLELLDEDTRCALQNVCRPGDVPSNMEIAANNEILVWGSNKNYNLGIGNEEGPSIPQSIDFFRKEHISVSTVALGAFHSLFLTNKAQLYAVGHGKGGRLGIGTENSLPIPKRVKVPIKNAGEIIICISASRQHSLVLTNHSTVFACGLNEDKQLGVRGAGEKLTVFKEVVTLRDFGAVGLLRVIAKDYFSLAYSEECIYVWGTNHGQIGTDKNVKTIPTPLPLIMPPHTKINLVEANNSATVVLTKDNTVLLYYNNKMKSIKAPDFEPLKSICIVGGDSVKSAKGSATALKLLLLTQTNVIFVWYEMVQNFYRCIFSQIRISQIDKILYKANQVIILSQGDVYQGKCNQIPVPVYANSKKQKRSSDLWSCSETNRCEISKDHMIRIDLQRIASIDRAVDIFCDEEFASYAVLQESHMKYFKLPILPAEEYSFKKLYNDINEFDTIHDLEFHVDGEIFQAHKLIVYARAPGLREIIKDYEDKQIYLNFELLTGKMFELMLKYMYMRYFPNADDLDDIQHSLGPDSPTEQSEICELFLSFVEKFHLNDLIKYLKSFLHQHPFYLPHLPDKSKYRFSRLTHKQFPELYDVRIICSNGDVEIPAHKCILVAGLEYFEMMFTHTWAEQSTIDLSTVPAEYMQAIVDFLYSADVEQFRKQNYSETYLYHMIVYCDQFFIERLRKVCEILILDKITLRKCGEMLDFACMYNCALLKNGCMDFISQNLARVLSFRSLESCEPETLQYLNAHYRKTFQQIFDYRMITPDAEAIEDEMLLSFVDDFKVDLNYRLDEDEANAAKNAAKTKQTENKTKQATRQHERNAISSMMESISLSESKRKTNNTEKLLLETKEIADKLQTESKNWTKVADKRESKKKLSLEHAVKANEILKVEEKPKSEFVALTKSTDTAVSPLKTPEKEQFTEAREELNTPNKTYNINFADLTATPREKLSQKQRKRLSSESSTSSPLTWRNAMPLREETKAIEVPVATPPNAWGVLPQSPTSSAMAYSVTPPTGSIADPTSFANMMRANAATSPSTSHGSNNFTQILAEERKQRDYYERLRTKSLVLTQIEETAIAELREFYNVDNVTDEIIKIERKSMPATMNFATWQRN